MSETKIYLCVTARPMSLLTACGELRCTATLSGQGRDRERERETEEREAKEKKIIGIWREETDISLGG